MQNVRQLKNVRFFVVQYSTPLQLNLQNVFFILYFKTKKSLNAGVPLFYKIVVCFHYLLTIVIFTGAYICIYAKTDNWHYTLQIHLRFILDIFNIVVILDQVKHFFYISINQGWLNLPIDWKNLFSVPIITEDKNIHIMAKPFSSILDQGMSFIHSR